MTGSRCALPVGFDISIGVGIGFDISIGMGMGIDSHLGRGGRSRTRIPVRVGARAGAWVRGLRSGQAGHARHGAWLRGAQSAQPHRIARALPAQRSIARTRREASVTPIHPVHSTGSTGSTGSTLHICPQTPHTGPTGASRRGDREGGGGILEVGLGVGREQRGRGGARRQAMRSRSVPAIGVMGERVVDTPGTIRADEGRVEGVKGRFGGRASGEWMLVVAGRRHRGTEKGIERRHRGRRRHEVGVRRSILFHYVLQIGERKVKVSDRGR